MTTPKKKYPFGKKVVDELLLLGANDAFKVEMDNFSKKYNPPADDDSGIDGKKEVEFMQNSRIFYMIKECMGIMEKYKLTKLFDYMMWYFLENKILAQMLQGEKVKFDSDAMIKHLVESSGIKIVEKNNDSININIHAGTSIKDMQQFWPEINKSLNKKTSGKKISKNLERDLRMLSLSNQKFKSMDIMKIINSDPNFKNNPITYPEVSRTIKRLKAKATNNSANKDS
jgi:hypothetical protein